MRRGLLITALLLLCACPVLAQKVALSVDTQSLVVDDQFRDPDRHETLTRFLPTLSLTLTGPVKPGSHLYLDLRTGLAQDIFNQGRQSTEDLRVVLRGEERRYRISARLGQSRFTSSVTGVSASTLRFGADTKEAGLNLTVTQPLWPALNLQYARFANNSGVDALSSQTTTTTSRVSAIYDLAPLRFHLDQSRRELTSPGGSGSEASSRRVGVSFDRALAAGLNLSANVETANSDNRPGARATTNTTEQIGLIQLSALPTPKVVLGADFASRTSHSTLTAGSVFPDSSSHDLNLSMRSEVLPGMQLNLGRDLQRSQQLGVQADTSSISADLAARIDSRNSAIISIAPTRIALGGARAISQNAQRVSWTTQLDSRTEATLSLDRFSGEDPTLGLTRTNNKYLSVRYRPDLQTSLGLGWLLSDSHTDRSDGLSDQSARVVDLDASWLPTSRLTLGGRLSLSTVSGGSSSRVSVPSFDIRWRPDLRTDIAFNWRLQSSVTRGIDDLNRFDLTLASGRLLHRLSSTSSLNLDYSVVKSSLGPLALERIIRLTFTSNWPR